MKINFVERDYRVYAVPEGSAVPLLNDQQGIDSLPGYCRALFTGWRAIAHLPYRKEADFKTREQAIAWLSDCLQGSN